MRRLGLLFAAVVCAACSREAANDSSRATPDPLFVGHIWIATAADAAPQSALIFLPDGTMMMTSCVETYRLSNWTLDGAVIHWSEDAAEIEAVYRVPNPDELWLRIGERDHQYRRAKTPYVCPDLPR